MPGDVSSPASLSGRSSPAAELTATAGQPDGSSDALGRQQCATDAGTFETMDSAQKQCVGRYEQTSCSKSVIPVLQGCNIGYNSIVTGIQHQTAAADASGRAAANQSNGSAPPQQLGNVTRILGHWYNLTTFAARHPGGPVALSLGFGRDSTILFLSHHQFTDRRVLAGLLRSLRIDGDDEVQLEKIYQQGLESAHPHGVVKLQSPEQQWDFSANARELDAGGVDRSVASDARSMSITDAAYRTLHDDDNGSADGAQSLHLTPSAGTTKDPFEVEVVAAVQAYFAAEAARMSAAAGRRISIREASKAPPERWMHIAILHFAFIVFGVLPLINGYWIGIISAPVLSWVCAVNTFHDAAHFALSANWRVNWILSYVSPWFTSPVEWYNQHVIGHHAYTNVAGA